MLLVLTLIFSFFSAQAADYSTSTDEGYLETALEMIEKGVVEIYEPDNCLEEGISTRGIEVPCDRAGCVGTVREIRSSHTQWKNNGEKRDCPKNWQMYDLQQSRTVTVEFQCNRCGYGFDVTAPQYQWVCIH